MKQRLHEVDHRLVWRLATRTLHLIASFLLLPAPQIHKHHQHPRFEDVGIDRECFRERRFGTFVVFRTAKTFEDAIDVTRAEAIMCEREVWIELDSTREMFDRAVAILGRQRAKDETSKQIATAQVLFVSRGITSRGFAGTDLLVRTELDTQAFDDALGDGVLEHDDV